MAYIENPKTKGSGILCAVPQKGVCPMKCADCFFQSGRSYLEPLDKNLPNLPSIKESKGRIVRINDGNDSNVDREVVEAAAKRYKDVFFNTSIPKDLGSFPGPVVLTVNPGSRTDGEPILLDEIPPNLMFVRVRVNSWNQYTVDKVMRHYADQDDDSKCCPVVMTFMGYYEQQIPDTEKFKYVWDQRTTNEYWIPTESTYDALVARYAGNSLVSTCGRYGTYACSACGNCLRHYYATKEKVKFFKKSLDTYSNPGKV